MIRVAFIGAGSIEFTRNVVADLCGYQGLGPLNLSLHDISAERLEFASRLVKSIVAQASADATVTGSLDRVEAITGARYVINEIQVGGYDSTLVDFDIPAKYGLRQTIADTIGIGGIFRGLRTIPVAVELASDMVRHCPDAYLLNYTNPMAMLPWAIYSGTDFERVYGLCHSVRDTHAFLAGLVGVPEAEIDFVTAGFNHQAFVLRFERGGESLYPQLAQVIDARPEGLGRRVRVELFRRFGYFPTESSEHSAEYVPWVMRHDSQVARFRVPVGEYLARCEENLAELDELTSQLDAGEPIGPEHGADFARLRHDGADFARLRHDGADFARLRHDDADFARLRHDELAAQFIRSLESDVEQEIYVNVRNDGRISNLPADACVEVPCDLSAAGPMPRAVGALPVQLAALNRTFLNVVELTVRAALTGCRDHVYQAALLDPNTSATLTTDQTVAMCDELLEAHAALLPSFAR